VTDGTEHVETTGAEIDETRSDEVEPEGAIREQDVIDPTAEELPGPAVSDSDEPTEPVAVTETEPVAEAEALAEAEPPADSEPPAEAEVAAEGDTDDVAAAVAAASEAVAAEPTLDDIAPGTVVKSDEAEEVVGECDSRANSVSIWPFVVYDVVWAAYAGVLVWQFEMLPPGTPVYEADLYPTAVLAGVVLAIAGPLLILATWIAAWGRPGSSKGRLFVSALFKGAVATALGVAMWWVALVVLDQLRLGRLL